MTILRTTLAIIYLILKKWSIEFAEVYFKIYCSLISISFKNPHSSLKKAAKYIEVGYMKVMAL